ncbi:hypothetical protein LCGC14_0684660 [marine sediment metagenome]|uniref:Uncharacterized protein n=1 Tax=marine sediment metagenome TaxID=412755 RepID=A0A0F9QMC8_9ZZZZ
MMPTKWSVNKAIESLRTLTNPFEKAGIQNPAQKPKLSEVIDEVAVSGNREELNGSSRKENTTP